MTTTVVAPQTEQQAENDPIPDNVFDAVGIRRPDEDTDLAAIDKTLRSFIRSERTYMKQAVQDGWMRIAMAAWIARDYRTWERDFPSFDRWCQQVLDIDRTNANKKIAAARDTVLLGANLRRVSHRQALARLGGDTDAKLRVLDKAMEMTDGRPTEKLLRALADEELHARLAARVTIPPGFEVTFGDGGEVEVTFPDTEPPTLIDAAEEETPPPPPVLPPTPHTPHKEAFILLPADEFDRWVEDVESLKAAWDMTAVRDVIVEATRRSAEAVREV
jgi:hypothetical protein